MLDRLDLDTDQPTEEELAKRFGYEEDFHAGASNILWNYWSSLHESTLVCMCLVEFGLHIKAPPYKKYLNEIFRLVLRALVSLCGNWQTRQNPKRKNFSFPNLFLNFDFKITHGKCF